MEPLGQPQQGFEGFQDSPDAPLPVWGDVLAGDLGGGHTASDASLGCSHHRCRALCDSDDGRAHLRWHRAIFLTTFESHAGRVRGGLRVGRVWRFPSRSVARCAIWPVRGTVGRSAILGGSEHGVRGVQHEQRCGCELATAWSKPSRAPPPPPSSTRRVLKTHPFVDGNLRAAYVALIVGLASVGLPAVDFRAVLDRHDECLGWAMRDTCEGRSAAGEADRRVWRRGSPSPADSRATLGREMKKIRYQDLDMPEGRCVADGSGIRPWDENTAAELALTGMLLSQGAKRAQAMLDAANARELAPTRP